MSNEIDFNKSDNLGGGKPGSQLGLYGFMDGGNERAVSRKYLTRAFGNLYNAGLRSSPALYNKNVLGPFRTAFNAGDVVTTNREPTNIKYGVEANKLGGHNLARVYGHRDGITQGGNAMFSGNPRHVFDSSDYTRFRKLQAVNKTFNDKSYGGANNNNTQSVLRRVRS